MISVSIVIAASRHRLLDGLLKSLMDQTFCSSEIIIICMKADEKIRELSSRYGAVLLEDEGKGRCYARNLGMKEAKGEITVFLDDDVILERDWLELIVGDFNLDSEIAGVGGIPIAIRDGEVLPFRSDLSSTAYDLMINKAQGLSGWPDYKAKVDFLSGSNMAFLRDVLLQIGGFDEDFYGPSAGEDVDLCLRVLKSGYYLVFDPKAKAYHYSDFKKRVSVFHRNDPSFFFALADNQTYWSVKNQTVRGLKWLPYLLFRFLSALYWVLTTQNIRIFRSYLRGILIGRMRAKNILCQTCISRASIDR